MVNEGDNINIPVHRLQGILGNIEIKWECLIESKQDITPYNGIVKFNKVTREIISYSHTNCYQLSFNYNLQLKVTKINSNSIILK